MRRPALRFLLVLPLLALALAPAFGQSKAEPPKGEDVVARMMRSTCFLLVEQRDRIRNGRVPVTRGSGSLIVDKQRKIVVTNYHVVGKYDEVWVLFPVLKSNGEPEADPDKYGKNRAEWGILGHVLDRWPEKDLALVELRVPKLPERLRPLPLAEKSPPRASMVHTMGNPAASALWSYTNGNVRSVEEMTRTFPLEGETLRVNARFVDTTNPLAGGDSGGPLVNDRLEQVGVAQSVANNASSMSCFIGIEEVWALLRRNKLDKLAQQGARTVVSAKEEKPPTPSKAAEPKAPMSPDDLKAKQERHAAGLLKLAKELTGAQRKDYLNDLIIRYPGTKAAAEAQELLDKGK